MIRGKHKTVDSHRAHT